MLLSSLQTFIHAHTQIYTYINDKTTGLLQIAFPSLTLHTCADELGINSASLSVFMITAISSAV